MKHKAKTSRHGVLRRQKPVRGGRQPLPATVLKDIYRRVDDEARRHNVSRSFVIAVALAHAFGVKNQEQI